MVNLSPEQVTARWSLTNTKMDPAKISAVCGIPEQECWDFLVELNYSLHEEEVAYRATADERRLNLQAFIDEVPNKKAIQIKSLLERLQEAKKTNRAEEAKRLLVQFNALNDTRVELTPQQVLKAKSAPIRGILGVDRVGNISCPFHTDKRPSFQITKKNTFTCHSCGVFGDSIDLYKRIHNCDFRTAVIALQ